VDVTSAAIRIGAIVASTAEKAGTSTTPPTVGEQDDLCMADPRLMSDPHTTEAGGAHVEDDAHRCLFASTPWEEEIVDRIQGGVLHERVRAIGKGPCRGT
jgi:hypothetical protein